MPRFLLFISRLTLATTFHLEASFLLGSAFALYLVKKHFYENLLEQYSRFVYL
jgi:hypothetical protein